MSKNQLIAKIVNGKSATKADAFCGICAGCGYIKSR